MKEATQNILSAIEKMHLGQEASLSQSQLKMVWDEIDELRTGTSARVGMGSTMKTIHECRTPAGEYFEFHYYDTGLLKVIRGSHFE